MVHENIFRFLQVAERDASLMAALERLADHDASTEPLERLRRLALSRGVSLSEEDLSVFAEGGGIDPARPAASPSKGSPPKPSAPSASASATPPRPTPMAAADEPTEETEEVPFGPESKRSAATEPGAAGSASSGEAATAHGAATDEPEAGPAISAATGPFDASPSAPAKPSPEDAPETASAPAGDDAVRTESASEPDPGPMAGGAGSALGGIFLRRLQQSSQAQRRTFEMLSKIMQSQHDPSKSMTQNVKA
jgi:hypothetical protein